MTKVNLQLEPGVDGRLLYFAGHLLKGFVELTLDHPKQFRGLYIAIIGSARAHWTKSERGSNRNSRYERINFEGFEGYINSKTYLIGQLGEPTFEMPPGTHRYEFTCQLPPHIPYTVGLKHAEIQYYVEAVLDIPWHFNKESKVPFFIIPYLDLNFYQHLKAPRSIEAFKNIQTVFCKSGRLQMTVHLPYSGFAIGQKVPIKIDYENKSNVDVSSTKMILRRIVSYHAQTPHPSVKVDAEDLIVTNTVGVKAGDSTSCESIFEIPIVILCTNEKSCRVLSITYAMKIEAVLSGWHSNINVVFPVVIGTVPIQFISQESTSYHLSQVPYVQPTAPAIPPSFEGY
ncbi:hypothetical protein ACKWTF_000222 [Chironomus riparius]